MTKNDSLLDLVVDYLNEQGDYQNFLDWAEMYDYDKEEIDEDIDNRHQDY